jgi:hypothetical protein
MRRAAQGARRIRVRLAGYSTTTEPVIPGWIRQM